MAEAKLKILDRLPVRVIGAVLNDVRAEGAYQYYSYLSGYGMPGEMENNLGPQVGQLTGRI
jgi:hypothetical protein